MENKIPTLKEIAKKLNFSVSTVSRALNNHPSIGLRTTAQVQKLAKEMGYEPNRMALLFKQQKTNILGVILPNLSEEFFSQAINGIENIARENDYSVLIGQSHDKLEDEIKLCAAMKNQRVDGVIASITKYTENLSHFDELKKYNIPVVFFDRVPESNNVHKVASNFTTSTRQAVEFLIAQGHKRIGIINGPKEMKSCKERVNSYMDALSKKKIKTDMSLVISTDLSQEQVYKATEELMNLKKPPTAILTINDYVALDAIQFVKRNKSVTNKNVVFVSYANLPLTNYVAHPPIASVEQYPYEQAEKASRILFELLDEKSNKTESDEEPFYRNVIIEGHLIVHKSNEISALNE
ncbi:MAG: LacI family DNA-binding transcriptional regulator [Ginsengibacter sp.]